MTAGNKYRITYYYVRVSADMNLEVRVGDNNTIASQTTVLEPQFTVNNTAYMSKTNVFIPTTDGTYYFSFRTQSATGGIGYLGVDNVSVEENIQKYYVNDNSSVGDVYCSAIGSDAGTTRGRMKSEPTATIEEVLANNVVEPGDTIFVDVGLYTMGTDITSADEGSSSEDMVIYGAASETEAAGVV